MPCPPPVLGFADPGEFQGVTASIAPALRPRFFGNNAHRDDRYRRMAIEEFRQREARFSVETCEMKQGKSCGCQGEHQDTAGSPHPRCGGEGDERNCDGSNEPERRSEVVCNEDSGAARDGEGGKFAREQADAKSPAGEGLIQCYGPGKRRPLSA